MTEHAIMPPITHREAIAAIPAGAMAGLREMADAPGLGHLAGQLALLVLSSWLLLSLHSWWLLLPLSIVQGILIVFLFPLEHECIHGTAFRSEWFNLALAEAAGFLLVLPPRYFRFFHLAHHRHTQDPGHDPELATPRPATWPQYLLALTGWGYWTASLLGLIRYATSRKLDGFVPERAVPRVILEARAYLAAYAILAAAGLWFGWTWLIWLWILPILLGQPFLRAYLMAEHTGLPLVPDMLLNSRTVFAAPLINWLAWNMPNHTAHHAVPAVPFHQLPALTELLRPHLRSTSPGYIALHRDLHGSLGNHAESKRS